MAYVSVDDDRLDEGPEALQFKSFLGADANGGISSPRRSAGVGNADRGYLQDQPHSASTFWNIEYYRPYFDVDTKTVLKRCYSTLLPTSSSYLSTHLTPAADLYGPFWTLTTLIFTLFLSSSLAASISAFLSADSEKEKFDYNFQLLSIAVSIVYSYGLAFPVLLWLGLRYIGVGEWSVVEALAIWGYAQFVWIPVSILCVIPVALVRWALVGIGFLFSGYFLVANVYPVLASAEAKATRLIVILMVVLHAGLALTFKILFFNYYISDAIIGPGEGIIPGAPGPEVGSGTNKTIGAVVSMIGGIIGR